MMLNKSKGVQLMLMMLARYLFSEHRRAADAHDAGPVPLHSSKRVQLMLMMLARYLLICAKGSSCCS